MSKKNEDAKTVKTVKSGDGKTRAKTGKPRKVIATAMRSKFANASMGFNTVEGAGGNFYSPELSTDFLELPQSLHEQWNYNRFFYRSEPFVAQAIDVHTELPLSKVRIGTPKAQNRELALAATRFCTKWADRVNLLERLISIVHERNLIGEVFVWLEDGNPDMPNDIRFETKRILVTEEGQYQGKKPGDVIEEDVELEDADERAAKWLKKNYKGWTSIRCLPPEQVRMESFNFTEERLFELIPDSKTKGLVEKANAGDKFAQRVKDSMPPEVVNAIIHGKNIPLNTDPMAGSFLYYLANKKSDYEPRGHSLLGRCMRTLVYRDKLRQAQTSISSRHMTPIRTVYGEDLSIEQVEDLRQQVDNALQDPDYSIVTNFEVRWEEMGADQRLLDLGGEYDLTDRQLYAGLGVTESLLSGESSYSGDRLNLEVINTRYMLLREQLQNFVQEHVFKPMCARMGFVEEDEDGDLIVLTPTLTFTRLALRDNRDTFDALWNLYTKGSLDVDTILELYNLDPVAVRERVERDLMTVNDPMFNEAVRGIYSDVGRTIAENSDAPEKVAEIMGLKYEKPAEEGGSRF